MTALRQLVFVPLCVLLALSAGCGGKAVQPAIPSGAELIGGTSRQKIIGYIATEPGTAYIVDVQTGKPVFTATLQVRDQLVFHFAKDMVFYNGELIRNGGFDPQRTYRLYFVKS